MASKTLFFNERDENLGLTFNRGLALQVHINEQEIEQVKETIFLGSVFLDENLSWKAHISHVANKISKSIGIISRSSFVLSKISLKSLYYSMIYPYLH